MKTLHIYKLSRAILLVFTLSTLVSSVRLDTDIRAGDDENWTVAPVKKTEFPGFVSVQHRGHHICGGIMLDVDFVLTSSSCLLNADGPKALTIVGNTVTILGDSRGDVRILKRAMGHPEFKISTREHDIALLHSKAFENKEMTEVLTAMKRPGIGDHCTVLSWKEINEDTSIAEKADVVVDEPFACDDLPNTRNATKGFLCVRGQFTASPGAILMCDGDVAGVFTRARDPYSEASLFTDVARYNEFIDDHFRIAVADDLPPEEVTRSSFWPWSTKAPPVMMSDDPMMKKVQEDCAVPFDHCYKVWLSDAITNFVLECKRGFHYYPCEYLMKRYKQSKPIPGSRILTLDPAEYWFRNENTPPYAPPQAPAPPSVPPPAPVHQETRIIISNTFTPDFTEHDWRGVQNALQDANFWTYMTAGYSYFDLN